MGIKRGIRISMKVHRFLYLLLFFVACLAAPQAGAEDCIEANAAKRCEDLLGDCGIDLEKKKFALVFGVEAYSREIGELKNTVSDAKQIAKILREVHDYNVRCILNATEDQARAELKTGYQIAKEFGKLASDAKEVRFLFYFSGHGYDQSQDSKGFIVFKDAISDDLHDIEVADIVKHIRQESKNAIDPFLLIDACRTEGIANIVNRSKRNFLRAGASGGVNVPRHRAGEFFGYAVAKGLTARDDEKRFMTFLAPELRERGMSFQEICESAALEANASANHWQDDGPQCISHSTVAGRQYFRLPHNQTCEGRFQKMWKILNDNMPSNSSRRTFLKEFAPEATLCTAWSAARSGQPPDMPPACLQEFVEKFNRFFEEKCSDEFEIAVVSSRTDVAAWLPPKDSVSWTAGLDEEGTITRGLATESTAEDSGYYRLRAEREDRVLVWREPIVVTSATGLRSLPLESAKPHTPVEPGTGLTLDCETLRCSGEWVGARYHPKDSDEVWRVFVPKSDIKPAEPLRRKRLYFVSDERDLSPHSERELEHLVNEYENRPGVRVKLVSNLVDMSGKPAVRDETSQEFEGEAKLNAAVRLSIVDSMIRRQWHGSADVDWDQRRKYEFMTTSVPGPAYVDVEIYAE